MEQPPGLTIHTSATVGHGKGGVYNYFDPHEPVEITWGRHLPHWRQPGMIYFVTFRTADSLPSRVLDRWRRDRNQWLDEHPEPHDVATARTFHRLFTERLHRYLDDGHGACVLRSDATRMIVTDILLHGDGQDYALDWFVVMPNHVHALVSPLGEAELSAITKAWKRVSAHRLNRMLARSGGVWQQESWDHIVRSPQHLDRYRRYIQENPARLPPPEH